MNRYPRWKVGLLIFVLLFSGLYALPNMFPDAPAVQISSATAGGQVPQELTDKVLQALQDADLAIQDTERVGDSWLVKFHTPDDQLKAKAVVDRLIGRDYVSALNLVATTPDWLAAIGASPMNLGLDLRGGVHFLLQVDMDAAIQQNLDANSGEIKQALRRENVRYRTVSKSKQALTVIFADSAAMSQGESVIRQNFIEYQIHRSPDHDNALKLVLTQQAVQDIQNTAIDQNRTSLSNRVNDLGVSNAVVRRQGADRIVVELPGIQDASQARRILGKTATLEFRLADENIPQAQLATGIAPPGIEVFPFKGSERRVAVKLEKIATGDEVVNAKMGFDQQNGQPEVNITLDSRGANRMKRITAKHVGDPMAVLFIENKAERELYIDKDGNEQERYETYQEKNVINVATIRDTLGSRFRITGLDSPAEASELALLLRAGSLAAPVYIVGESTIGPSMGMENIVAGMKAMGIGLLFVLIYMCVFYRFFGLIACVALVGNFVLLVGVMSLIPGATLTLSGIAGVVLTMGMAVDANVLIYEQIKQSMKNGMKPLQAIDFGYDRAFVTIVDANITTLIAAVVLLAMGSGSVQGFAITLIIGILASMFTAIVGSRAIVEAVYKRPGRKAPTSLSI